MNNYKINITQRAYSSITECVLFVNNVSSEAANSLYEEIMHSVKSLLVFPNKYPEIQGLSINGIKIRKMIIHSGRYIILYKVEGELIVIYDIIDSRKDNAILRL